MQIVKLRPGLVSLVCTLPELDMLRTAATRHARYTATRGAVSVARGLEAAVQQPRTANRLEDIRPDPGVEVDRCESWDPVVADAAPDLVLLAAE